MKKALILITVLMAGLLGCGYADRKVAALTGYTRHCIDGVSYLQFPSGATVEYTPEGKIKTCK